MEWRSLLVKVDSCRDLKGFNLLQKQYVYSLVYINSSDVSKKKDEQQRTPVDRHGGKNPEWNHVMKFDLENYSPEDRYDYFLKFKICCEGVLFGNKNMGEVNVPLKELVEEYDGGMRFVSYQIRSCDNKSNGVLNFSYNLSKLGSDSNQPIKSSPVSITSNFSKTYVPSSQLLIRYPTVESDPLPVITNDSLKFERRVGEVYASAMKGPPLQMHGTYYYPYTPPPVVQYNRYPLDPRDAYGYGLRD